MGVARAGLLAGPRRCTEGLLVFVHLEPLRFDGARRSRFSMLRRVVRAIVWLNVFHMVHAALLTACAASVRGVPLPTSAALLSGSLVGLIYNQGPPSSAASSLSSHLPSPLPSPFLCSKIERRCLMATELLNPSVLRSWRCQIGDDSEGDG